MGGGNNKRGQKLLMLKVDMSNGHVACCQQLLPESSRLAVPQTLTMDKVNVVSALPTLNVAPNTKGKEKPTEQQDRRGDIWDDLGGVPTRFLYMKSANFLTKTQFSGKLLPWNHQFRLHRHNAYERNNKLHSH